MVECLLIQCMTPVNSIHNLQGPVRIQFVTSGVYPIHETRGLFSQPYSEQPIEREGRVSNPGVSVIPVTGASNGFGQTASRRRYNRACWRIGEQLERQRGTMHHFAPAAGVCAFRDPAKPVCYGTLEILRSFSLRH